MLIFFHQILKELKKIKDDDNQLFIKMVDNLKRDIGQSALAVARRIGMLEHTMKNIKAGRAVATAENVKALLSHFPELSDLAAQNGLTVPNEPHPKSAPYTKPVVEEPPPIYHRMPDSIASTLQRIESILQEIRRHQEERTKEDQKNIQKLIEYITSTRTL